MLKVTMLLLSISLSAQATVVLNDQDLSGLEKVAIKAVPTTLSPDRIQTIENDQRGTKIELYIDKKGKLIKIDHELFSSVNCSNTQTSITASLSFQNYFEIRGKKTYQLTANLTCQKINQLIFKEDSDAGQAFGIWRIARTAVEKFGQANALSFWKKKITINWPASGDYYSFNKVNITRGDYWDVVGHELGHAIYDQGNIGAFGGGSHKIDECYSQALALSEGWASFFSAWLSIDVKDTDAQFEYMVPRRAPLKIEHVPSDVCASEKNEWRVTGWLWDIIDQNDDQESISQNFIKLWNATLNRNFKNAGDMAIVMKELGISDIEDHQVWEQNFLQPR